ncbi:hypothetical protein [Sicyoidochytrium minutum DNA virus]|nr:hypothetical protein [Sicyoidochytrium minutum DNA virus]
MPCRPFYSIRTAPSTWNPKKVWATTKSLGGHFAGDGCHRSERRRLTVFTMDEDTASEYKRVFGGTVKREKKGFNWSCNAGNYLKCTRTFSRYAWTKRRQMEYALECHKKKMFAYEMKDVMVDLKANEDPKIEDGMFWPGQYKAPDRDSVAEIVGGFLTADGSVSVNGKYKTLRVKFTQKKPGMLHAIKAWFPTPSRVIKYHPRCSGKTHDNSGNIYVAHRLVYCGESAYVLLDSIMPHIVASRVKTRAWNALVSSGWIKE